MLLIGWFTFFQDKSGKKPSPQSHHWITMNTGTQGTVVCDICMKQLSNKTIIQCESTFICFSEIETYL